MRVGDILKVRVENISSSMTEDDFRNGLSPYGTVQAVTLHRGYVEVTFTSNGTRLLDSSGIGELRLQDRGLRVTRT